MQPKYSCRHVAYFLLLYTWFTMMAVLLLHKITGEPVTVPSFVVITAMMVSPILLACIIMMISMGTHKGVTQRRCPKN